MIIVANKHDLWRANHSINDFNSEFQHEIAELARASNATVPSVYACSVKTGYGIGEIMRELLRLSGWEIRLFFGIKVRFRRSLLE